MQEKSQNAFLGRFAYLLTDFCGNLLFCIIGAYLLYFYTDVFGLPIAITGTLLLATRILDCLDAPIWGSIVDHTKSKYGKSRPYFLWLAVPFGLSMWLTFTTPDFLSETGKIIYAVFTYLIAGIVYSGVQTAITSILPNLTSDHKERMVLNTFRMVGGSIGAFICMTFTLPLVKFFGQGSEQRGFSITVGMFAIIVVILMIFAFRHLREQNVSENESIPVKDSIRAIKNNWPWILLVSANFLAWVGFSMRQGTVIYFCKYNLGDDSLTAYLNGILTISCLLSFLTMTFIVKYTRKFGAMCLGLLFIILGYVGINLSGTNVTLIMIFWAIGSFGQGLSCAMPFGMLADTVDYGEWKNHVRAPGFLTAIGSALCIKGGSGLGAFIPALIMTHYGYVANAEQTTESLFGIEMAFIWCPIVVFIVAAIPMLFYRKYELIEGKIISDLKARKA